MATSRLYPTLTKFYGHGYHDIEDNDIDLLLSQNKLHRKDNTTSLKPKDKNISNHLDHINKVPQTGMLYPNISQSVLSSNDNQNKQEYTASNEEPTVPSAPPIELWDEELLRFLEQALKEQQGNSTLDDTPTADYSSFTIPTDLLLNETWIDDLQPDYDIAQENSELQYLNNLNKTDRDKAKFKTANISKTAGCSVELNIRPESKRPVVSERRDLRRSFRIQESTGLNRRLLVECRAGCQKDHTVGMENRDAGLEGDERSRPAPGSPEYNAWMTWRKQVNRQLATVILLRQGGRVWLQKGDMSRKHLNQRSIDFVSKVVKSGNKTSLGGKPFVMYGIPRASLSASQIELTKIGRH
ncbi:unnamed protein product [Candidula unifasciata]|uniref:Uncharacterized protein n=1 Tax=Candidula unifasciata TaxID=100452 RepID=A0A8S3ZW21_9EUPU|nr:unnamed protein product [Candidula unifasciata]